MTDDPEMWASILGWHCWRGVAGIWYARRIGAAPAVVLRAGSLDALRALIKPVEPPGLQRLTGQGLPPHGAPA